MHCRAVVGTTALHFHLHHHVDRQVSGQRFIRRQEARDTAHIDTEWSTMFSLFSDQRAPYRRDHNHSFTSSSSSMVVVMLPGPCVRLRGAFQNTTQNTGLCARYHHVRAHSFFVRSRRHNRVHDEPLSQSGVKTKSFLGSQLV